MSSLRSDDTRNLLDIVDTLRAQGIGNYIDLPQIIVCGEQSSGKSSVLEAISGLAFPTKDAVCTRFATEVILRRNAAKRRKISIVPGANENHDAESLKRLRSIDMDETENDNWVDLGKIIEDAKLAMGIAEGGKTFSSDILRIELCGPDQPHLTLVDLPGLYQSGSKGQSVADSETVKSLVTTYMENQRSIILAVVSAKNDFNNQIITSLASSIDSGGRRTLGLITKPDTLYAGSDSEKFYIKLAQNLEVNFALGWHVLRNRDIPEKDMSLEERNVMEKEFFSNGAWTSLPPSHLGVDGIKPRLSKVLKVHIVSQLPSVLSQIEEGVVDCETNLQRLGSARETMRDQRLYLLDVSSQFTNLLKVAIKGSYDDKFFGDATTDAGYAKRLRAVAQNTLTDFAKDMRLHGHVFHIVENDERPEEPASRGEPCRISRSEYLDKVTALLRRSRGRELSGLFDPLIVGDLFYEQSKPWEGFILNVIDDVIDATYTVIHAILNDALDEHTRDGVLSQIINPGFEELKTSLQSKVKEIMKPHMERHPITLNHYLTDTVQKIQIKRREDQTKAALESYFGKTVNYSGEKSSVIMDGKALLAVLANNLESNMESYASSTATDFMQAYYKVALETVVDNISTLAIEECLIQPSPMLFCPQTVFELEDSVVSAIAAEDAISASERKRLNSKLDILGKGLRELKKLHNMKPLAFHNSQPENKAIPGVPEPSGGRQAEHMNNGYCSDAGSPSPTLSPRVLDQSSHKFEAESPAPELQPQEEPLSISEPCMPIEEEESAKEVTVDDPWGFSTISKKKKKKKKRDKGIY